MMYKDRFIAVIKHNNNILREVDDVVRLPFGSEYSILLKNLESRQAVVNVSVNGEDVLDGNSIIVESNSNFELKGFMKHMSLTNRFKFIRKTKEIAGYRGDLLDDGIVRVEFRFEKKKVTKIIEERRITRPCCICHCSPCTCCDYTRTWVNGSSDVLYCCNSSDTFKGLCNMTYTSSFSDDNSAPLDDEGLTVKGSEINQNFVYGTTDDLEESSSVIILRLKGTKTGGKKIKKALTVKSKVSCPTCGRKSKSGVKFCSNCATFLD